ncbi:glycosyltransferase family 2 protein [Candidatus Pseudothioglobus singularis]|nr:glycosyltransferase family 2 protein [Candidatus Pseudothioglobus singularis]
MSKNCIIVPAYNEDKTIISVINDLQRYTDWDIIVIDDGSKINLKYKLDSYNDVHVIRHEFNLGYENALNSGFDFAIANNYRIIATYDSDGQFFCSDLKKIMDLLINEKVDIVAGNRKTKNRSTESLISYLSFLFFKVHDPLCGLKIYDAQSISKFMPFDTNKLIGMEILFKSIKGGLKVINMDVKIKPRNDESRYSQSFMGELRMLIKFIKASLL